MQNGNLSREAARDNLSKVTVKPSQALGLVEMTPRNGPSFQFDLWSQEMFDLDDPRIEIGEVRGRTGLAILKMETNLETASQSVGPNLVVDAVVAIVELEKHRVGVMTKSRELNWHVRPHVSNDCGEKLSPIERGLAMQLSLPLRVHIQETLA